MKHLVSALILATALSLASTAPAALPGGISGHWYNPDQSGHGLSVTLANPELAIVVWHVFDTDGNPMTLYIEGEVSGRAIEGTAYAPKGMRFGMFDPANFEAPQWGEVDLEFDNCVEATLRWDSSDPAFGSGSMPLERLAFTHGLDCKPPSPGDVPAGLYIGRTQAEDGIDEDFQAVVDLEGRLWGMDRGRYPIPSPMWVGARLPWVVLGRPVDANSSFEYEGRASKMYWTFPWSEVRDHFAASGEWFGPTGGGELRWLDGDSREWTLTWSPATETDKSLVAPLTLSALAGRYEVPMSDQTPGGATGWLEIGADGSLCIEMPVSYGNTDKACHFTGQVRLPDGDAGLVDFEAGTYHGRGYMADGPNGLELVLVGDDHLGNKGGFGLVAYPES
ncbi:hypothetical protein [Wenzhouxiangella sp. EGI_FJ10305]|uniref:hypothetical protein n=1 Tax=Wenzhouxiangella sp. EGI_FJ10305 TaxID=3243768 RepID=UPI0035D614E4